MLILGKILNKKIIDNKFLDNFFKNQDFTNNIFVNNFANEIKKMFLQFSDKIILDKSPLNFIWIGFIKILFPNAKIIHCKEIYEMLHYQYIKTHLKQDLYLGVIMMKI